MRKYDVYGIGAALVDTEIEVTDQDLSALNISKGLMTLVDENRHHELSHHFKHHIRASRRASGGSAANSIIAASLFGGRAFFSGRVADDDNGAFYLQGLADADVAFPQSQTLPAGTTGKCLVLITPDAERTLNTYLGVSESLSINDLNFDALAESEYLYLEGYLVTSETGKAAAIAAMKAASEAGTKRSLSLSDPGIVTFFREGLMEIIGDGIDLLFCNSAEAKAWSNTDSLDEAIENLKAVAKHFAVTQGSKGALIYDGRSLHRIKPYPITAVDTNGAGDMFAGAFLYGITHGFSYAEAGDLACAAASAVVGQFGPRLPLEQQRGILEEFKSRNGR